MSNQFEIFKIEIQEKNMNMNMLKLSVLFSGFFMFGSCQAQFLDGLLNKVKESVKSETVTGKKNETADADEQKPDQNIILTKNPKKSEFKNDAQLRDFSKMAKEYQQKNLSVISGGIMFGVQSMPPVSIANPAQDYFSFLDELNKFPNAKISEIDEDKILVDKKSDYAGIATIEQKSFELTQNLLKGEIGIMEPILKLNKDFKISVDTAASAYLYAKLAKNLKLKPLKDSYTLGEKMVQFIDAEFKKRMEIEANDSTSDGHQSLGGALKQMFKVGERANIETEWTSIYNTSFFNEIKSAIANDVQYVIFTNKDNYLVSEMPQIYSVTSAYTKFLAMKLPKALSGEKYSSIEVIAYYAGLKAIAQTSVFISEEYLNFANFSIDIISKDRLSSLISSGGRLKTETRFSVSDYKKNIETIQTLMYAKENFTYEKSNDYCQKEKSGTLGDFFLDNSKCVQLAKKNYKYVWSFSFDQPGGLNAGFNIGSFQKTQIDRLDDLIKSAKIAFGISGKVNSKPLK